MINAANVFSEASSWIAGIASLMVLLTLFVVSVSLTGHLYWSLILRSCVAKLVV